jgi:uncharacterized protein YeaO (DUF488 family)
MQVYLNYPPSEKHVESSASIGIPAMEGALMIKLKRVYEQQSPNDGKRFLVERLWPRGIKKSALSINDWLKDVGPSTDLRQWFGHDPQKWSEFCTRYFSELDAHPAAWEPILMSAQNGTITLVYSSQDTEHNNAVALKNYLEKKLRITARPKHKPAA